MRRVAAAVRGTMLLLVVAEVGAQAQTPAPAPAREPWLVTTSWLQEHLTDPNLVVLQVAATRREYRQGHLPGARFLWSQSYAPSTPDGTYELPSLEQAAALAAELGLRPDSRIVLVYSGVQVQQTARALLTLEQYGLGRRASILNGGFDAWKAGGRLVSTDTPQFAAGTARPAGGGRFIADAAYVQAQLNQPSTAVVDAREARFYKGEGGGQPRPGHIPGAINVPFASLLDGSRIRDEAALREIFAAAGVRPGTEVITYCHVGQQASLVWLAARILGHDARLYDGSFEDWSGRDDLPVVNPSAVAK